jgi:hypothetical protein
MCDDSLSFLGGATAYHLSNILWDIDCDYVEFDCDFPGQPYQADITLISKGCAVMAEGYLFSPPLVMPDCGGHTPWRGTSPGIRPCEGGTRNWLRLQMRLPDPNPSGLSGAPVTIEHHGQHYAVAAFSSIETAAMGGLYVAPVLS